MISTEARPRLYGGTESAGGAAGSFCSPGAATSPGTATLVVVVKADEVEAGGASSAWLAASDELRG